MEKRTKRLLSCTLAALLIFSLGSCGTPAETPSSASSTPALAPAASEPSPSTSAPSAEDIQEETPEQVSGDLQLQVNDRTLTATWADNSSAEALRDILADGPLTISMRDYASMEKVGSIGQDLPTNNEQITTEAGDLILYQGNAFVIYYAPNSWNFTRLGKINDVSADELKEILGSGDVSVTLSLVTED